MVAEFLDIEGTKRENSLKVVDGTIKQSDPLISGVYDLKVSVPVFLAVIGKGKTISTLDSDDYDYPAGRVGQVRVRDMEKVAVKSQDGSAGEVFLFRVTK